MTKVEWEQLDEKLKIVGFKQSVYTALLRTLISQLSANDNQLETFEYLILSEIKYWINNKTKVVICEYGSPSANLYVTLVFIMNTTDQSFYRKTQYEALKDGLFYALDELITRP